MSQLQVCHYLGHVSPVIKWACHLGVLALDLHDSTGIWLILWTDQAIESTNDVLLGILEDHLHVEG